MSDETLDEGSPQGSDAEGIAVIGMAGRFPGAADVAALWRNVRDGVEAVTRWSREELAAAGVEAAVLDDPRYVRAGGVVPGTEMFDAPFFGFSPREAEIMDPQQRLFLEQAWTALENAGYDSESFSGSIGIFGGMGMSNYLLSNLLSHPDLLAAAGSLQVRIFNDKDFLVSLAAFKLNLTGPSINVQTACSTSLVATCLACQSLLAYQCDIALAGGVTLSVPAVSGYAALESVMSPSGVCRAFDAAADGTVGGSGAGLVVLKRLGDALADGDTIHAVIKGFATNNDGGFKMGYTAPGVDGQVEVIAMAQAVAGIKGDTIGYVEAHGTGTPLGDPVEVEALTEIFRSATDGIGTCALGSIKTNIGHLDTAAGVASLIKAVLALEHRIIPPNVNFTRPNPQIDFANSPFYVPTQAAPWEPRGGAPRRAGVSSFAIGGVNAHVVLEEAPASAPGAAAPPWMLLPLSARTETALAKRTDDFAAWLRERPELTPEDFANAVFTLQTGRRPFRHRRVLVCRDREDALACLEGREPKRRLGGVADEAETAPPRVAFLFPGLGNHHVGMARGLYESEPRFREVVDECAELLVAELGVDLREVLWPEGAPDSGKRPHPRPLSHLPPTPPPGEGRQAEEVPVSFAGLPSPGDRAGGAGRGAGGEGAVLNLRALLGRGSASETPADAEAARRLARTELAQPAVFVIEIALARLLIDLGVQPDAFLGFSIGEYVAACLAGVMELPDALRLVARRARLIGSLPEGAMLAVPVSEAEAREMAREGSGLSVAAVIGPALSVLAGPVPAVDAVEERLTGQGMVCRRLQTTHAFHSRMMEPILARFRDLFQGITLRAPEIPFVSNVTGTWITDAEAQSPAYWADHLRQAVRFGDGLGTLWRDPGRTLVEVGPGQTLASWALQHPAAARGTVVVPAMRHTFDRQDDPAVLLTALGRLWLAGVRFDWRALWTGRRRRVPLPTYPFERQRYWIEKRRSDTGPQPVVAAPVMASAAFPTAPPIAQGIPPSLREGGGVVHARPPLGVAFAEPRNETERALAWMWREMLGLDRVGVHDGFFDLGGDSLLATRLVSRLNETFGIDLTLRSVFEAPSVAELAAEVARRRGMGVGKTAPAGIPRQAPGATRPLSFAQRRLWFLDQLEPDNPFYNVSGASSLQGGLDPVLAARAFTEVVRRHDTLRTSFHAVDGEATLTVDAPGPWTLPLVDLSALPADAAREETLRLARAEARQPFDLRRPPLLRTTLVRIAAREHALFTTMHHIISDGWSNNLFLREMVALYDAFSQGRPSPLPELPIQYTDFAAWQIEQMERGILGEQLAAWRRRLNGLPPSIDLPTDRPRPAAQTFRGARIPSFLPDALTADLRRLGREVGGTLFMSLFATLATFLYRHTGQEDFAIGVPVANRNRLETEGLIGFFTNTLVVRTAPAGRMTFRELLRAVRGVTQEAFENQDLPFEKLVEELQPQRDLSRSPFFQVMLVSTPLDQTKAEGFAWQRLDVDPEVGRFDLLIDLSEMGDQVAGVFEYSTDLFDLATAERMERRLQTLLAAVAAAPGLTLAELPMLPPAERAQVLAEWSTGPRIAGSGRLAHQWVEEQAERTPGSVAVVGLDGAETTYAELIRRSRQLADHLRGLGVGPETRVALSLDRSPELLIAMLGVLQAGGAYVPLDPAYPAERRELMLADSGAAVVVTREMVLAANDQRSHPEGEPREREGSGRAETSARPDPLGRRGSPQDDIEEAGVQNQPGLDNLAYVLYTSGSTGRPKGVAMVHRALANLVAWQTASMPGAWRTLQFTSLNFDVSFQEIFATWATGGTLVLISEEDRRDPVALLATLRERRVERLFLPFVALQQLAEAAQAETRLPASLREVVTAGEQLRVTPALAAFFRRLPGARLHNHYGPTESHVLTHFTLAGDPAAWPPLPPIGRPFSGVRTVVLDKDGGAAPVGVTGELMLGGVCLARGYLGRPDLTAERFVPDPFASELGLPGARLYRTGDRARWLPDGGIGDIEFLGRLDDQVKIRGYRVEPGEIEAVLGTHPRVAEAVVGVVDRGDGDRRLVAWVIVKGEPPYAFRKYLADRLPEYEVPSAFLFVDAMPLTPSGKVDRSRLAAEARGAFEAGETVQPADARREWTPPRTPAEELLAGIWSEVLRVPRIGVQDDFFALGGHSLLATRVMARLRTASGVALPVRALFEAPTLEALAARVEQEGAAGVEGVELPEIADSELPPVVPVLRPDPVPVSFAQERIWFLDRLLPGLPTYNLPLALELVGPLGDREAAALAATLSEIARRHEALRTVFPEVAGSPVQEILPPAPFALPLVDLQALPAPRRVAEAERLAALWVRGLLDLRRGPLLAAVLLRLDVGDDERHRFVLEIHHIVADGWSIGLLVREIAALYPLFAGLPGAQALPELDLQYADYTLWQRRWLRGGPLRRLVDAWRRRLEGAPPALELPADRPRQGTPSFRGANAAATFDAADLGRFNARAQSEGVTLFMLLLAAWQTLLHRASGQDHVVVGTPVAGRNRPELEPLIGIFINTLALHGDLSGDPTFRTLLERTRDVALEAFALQDLPFEKLVEELQPVRDTARTPLFQVMLVLQNAPYEALALPGLTLTPVRVASSTSKFDLLLGVQEENGRLETFLEHDSALFDRTTADRLLGHFGVLLRAAAADPDRRLSTLPRLTEGEQAQLTREWNDTAADREATSVPALIAAQARRDPDAVAVVFEGETLTRGELDAWAGRLADRLRAQGAGPETVVAVSMQRSLELVVALLAVWKAGAAYLPLDPEDPEERRRKVVEAARPVAVVEEKDFKDSKDLKDGKDGTAGAVVAGEQLAYVIYTSGSTGAPKGAMGHHRGLLNRLAWGQETWRLGPADAVLGKTPVTFDVSVWEMFWPLVAGARLVLARPGGHRDPRHLAELIAKERVTVAHFVPSMLRAFLDDPAAADAARSSALRLVIASGEALAPDLAQRFARQIGAPLHNLYGPTEASIEVTAWACGGEEAEPAESAVIPIGRPVANVRIQVVDPAGELVPVGQPGELCIGGVAVGRGYLGRPDLTAERFVPDPWGEPGSRVYRSGDLARVRADGAVEYLGRLDQQVKVRGVRIEPGEIEAVLAAHPAVREAVVLLRDSSLVAFIVSRDASEPDPAGLRAFLRRSLPEAMIPASFVFLPSLPLTRSGKTDRRALEQAGAAARATAKVYEAPRTSLEEWLVEQCADLLGLPRVGIQDNFFELGGHSLLGTQLIARLRDDWRVELPVPDLFAAADLAALADRITDLELEAAASSGTLDDALAELGDLSPEELKALLGEG